jgi:hypothetical protein
MPKNNQALVFNDKICRFDFMKSKKTAIALLILLFSLNSFAQQFERKLKWQEQAKTFSTIDGKIITVPYFAACSFYEQYGNLPVFSEKFDLPVYSEVTAEITNAIYSPVSNIDVSSNAYISSEIKINAFASVSKKMPRGTVWFVPLRKNPSTGKVEKLESFTLKVKYTPKAQAGGNRAYAANSVLASGNWYKVAVTGDGIYKITYDFVKTKMGVEPGSFNLNSFAVYGNGGGMIPDRNSIARFDDLQENATLMVDNNGNNKFDQDDYLLFYGQMPDAWKFDNATQLFKHEKNLYSDKTYYFITTDKGTGKRAATATAGSSPTKTITEYDEHFFHESDEVNLQQSGKVWLGDKMTSFSNTKSFNNSFPGIITSSPVRVVSSIAANTNYGSSTVMNINGQNLITHNENGINPSLTYPPAALPFTVTAFYNAGGEQLNVGYTFNISADPSGSAACYIDYFEMHMKRSLSLYGNSSNFRSIASVGAADVSEFRLGNMSGNKKVWDVTDATNAKEMPGSLNGSQFSFVTPTNYLKEFIAFDVNGGFSNPEMIEKVANQDLHAIGQPDMIIISPPEFRGAADALADFHRSYDNLTVSVVNLPLIYNEFGSGKQDISAIRDFMKMMYDRAGSDTSLMTEYLVLFGDGSYDPKSRIDNANNFIPTYQSYETYSETASYTSDDFFGLLDASEGGEIADNSQDMDVAIGRLPVGSSTEANAIVQKIINYKTKKNDANCATLSNNNSWRNSITFIADDEDYNTHINSTEDLAEHTRSLFPVFNYEKIYLDAYKQQNTPAGDRYPDVNKAILDRMNSGTLIMNWVGHGGETNWAHERIFNMADIVNLENGIRLPLFVTATCEFSRFDLPARTAGEWLVVNDKGGAIASITTVRLVYSNANEALNDKAFSYIFAPVDGRDPRLGEILTETKNTVVTDPNNTRKFTLLGDPALTLNYPKLNIITTEVNGQPIALPHDTLKALAKITIKGEVRDDNGNKMTGFNGVVYPAVYDKLDTMQTLKNDATSQLRNFLMYRNILFKGKASVVNGDFNFTFIVPKDIDYQFGSGRISYYADAGDNIDGNGFTNDIIIGGSADSFNMDAAGPVINLYMNDEKFVFGGTTDETPMLLAKMEDESGINTAGNGIGHDLTAILDDNTQNRIVLNDFYEAALDNYMAGEVRYPFSKLAIGKHTLKMKAWDIQNNSSEDMTEFVVADNAKLALTHVFNYPNPFTTHTQFMFEHNRPCDDLNVTVQIYTVSGKVVKTLYEQINCGGYRVDDLVWDGLDEYGDPIGKGVYVYKVNVRDSSGNSAHKFEKLVVLR